VADHWLSGPGLTSRSHSARLAWSVAAGIGAAAASTLCTAGAAAAAGRQADLALQPVELALRVGLLLVAPCAGALLAAIAIPRAGGRATLAAIGIGVPIGPLLVLRLDRMSQFGAVPALLTVAVLVLWGIAGSLLASSWWRRPSRAVESSVLPGSGVGPLPPGPGTVPADPLSPPLLGPAGPPCEPPEAPVEAPRSGPAGPPGPPEGPRPPFRPPTDPPEPPGGAAA
jgi:hypothetical protein